MSTNFEANSAYFLVTSFPLLPVVVMINIMIDDQNKILKEKIMLTS